ncbi:31067_t:CDS:1 [Gigaspora margarita]|uniref:31067_t:CDS:1 n=1 Tax=Gigaspora margarita TaxID=4874 RepID=A0ABN7VBK4_GIGMA|nr:31067_t:CDS:1 [Gigaspora margarita]
MANSLLLITEEWILYFVFAITLITVGLKILYSNQSDEEKKFREGERKMKKIYKRIKDAVGRFLNMEYLIPELEFCSDNSLKIKWNNPKNVENDKLASEILYKLHIIIIFGTALVEKDIIVGKEEIDHDHKILSYTLIDDLLMKCKKVSVKITAILQHSQHENYYYSGLSSQEGEIEHKTTLYPPTELNPEYNSRNKILTTKIVSVDNDTQQYYCEIFYNNDGNYDVAYSEIINMDTLESTLWTINTDENLMSGPGGEYKIRVLAKAINWKESEFKYADKVILRLSPPKHAEFRRIYDNNIEFLKIIVKEMTDQQSLQGYTYDVINDNVAIYSLPIDKVSINPQILKLNKISNITKKPTTDHYIRIKNVAKENSNWMDSSYTLSIKSFKFFSGINNIKGSYNIKNNVLKVSWDPVENAKKYEITLYYDKTRLATDLTSELFINFDIWKLKKKIESYSRSSFSSYKFYTFTVQATNKFINEDGFCDGPITKIEKDFKQLPKPTNVIMIKKPDRLNVSYDPITFSESSKIFKGYMVKLYKVQPRNRYSVTESLHLVAESPLIKDITSRYYDFIIKDIKFEENRNYQVEVEAEVYAVVSNDQAINSFPEKSVGTMKFLPSPNDLQISAKAEESYEPMFVVSCIFNLEIRNYVLGVKNIKTEKTIKKIITDPSPSERVEQILFLNNSDLLDSTDSSEIVKFCAFAQAIGDCDQLDSNIVMSASEVKQYEAPHNVTYVFKRDYLLPDTFEVSFEGTEGYYEIHIVQIINGDNYQIIKKKETKEKEVIVQVNNLKNGIYKVRVRQIPQEPDDLTRSISSNWKVSEKSTTISN